MKLKDFFEQFKVNSRYKSEATKERSVKIPK